jgi:hypothetical protein
LFFTYPALIALGYVGMSRLIARLTEQQALIRAVLILIALVGVCWPLPYRTFYLHGPDEAAKWLVAAHPNRILYCGDTDGNFVFAYRSLQAGLGTAIITGEKLAADAFSPAVIEQFAHDYGIDYIVVEDRAATDAKRAWGRLMNAPSRSMSLQRDIAVESSTDRWNGTLRIYRFNNPSPHPKDVLSMKMWSIGLTMDFPLGK